MSSLRRFRGLQKNESRFYSNNLVSMDNERLDRSLDLQLYEWFIMCLFTIVFLLYCRRCHTSRCGAKAPKDDGSKASNAILSSSSSRPFEMVAGSSPVRRKRHDSNASVNCDIEMIRMPSLRGIDDTEPCMLQRRQISHLCKLLPSTTQLCDWRLLYTSSRDGYSLETFYRLCERRGPTLMIVSDTCGALFGGYNSMSWRRPTGGDDYFGTGECFVFREYGPSSANSARENNDDATLQDNIWSKYGWTGVTDEFVLAGHKVIAFGGGGKFAFSLGSNFREGSSDQSPTYENACLASSTMFTVAAVEVWSFETSW